MGNDTSYLHRDQLASVQAMSNDLGQRAIRRQYRPFGEISWEVIELVTADEAHGFIGERFDEGAGLQYLNARYYDPELGLFLQPDWFEVTKAGVGTNRYSYSFNDPVNLSDPTGNRVGDLSVGCSTCDYYDHAEGANGTPSFGDYSRHPEAEAFIEATYDFIGDVSGINGAGDAISSAVSGDVGGVVMGVGEIAIGKVRAAGKIVEPVVDYGQQFFRGARPGQVPDFTPRPNEYKVDPQTGFVRPTHGVSVFDNPESVAYRGFDPHRIDQSSVPDSLDIIQRGRDPSHFEVVPKPGSNLTPDQFIRACQSISCTR